MLHKKITLKDLLRKLEEITDINITLIKTSLHLIIFPKRVIITENSSYTSSIKYTLVVVTGVFFIMAFVDQISIKEFIRPSGLLPLRVEYYQQESEKILEEFGSFILLLALVPTLAVILRLVFHKTTSWRNSFKISLYVNSQSTLIFKVFSALGPGLPILITSIYWLHALWALFNTKEKLISASKLLLVFILFSYLTVGFIVDLAWDTIVNSLNRVKHYELDLSSTEGFLIDEVLSESLETPENTNEMGVTTSISGTNEYRWLKGDNNKEWSLIGLIKVDSTEDVLWETNIFSKHDLYYAAEPKKIVDTLNQHIAIAYALPNDSLTVIHLVSKHIKSGSDRWQTKIPIKLDYANLDEVAQDENHFYLLGNAVLGIRKFPWQPEITVVFHIVLNKENGTILSHKYYGKRYPYYSTTAEKLVINDSTIEVYGTYKYHNFSNLIIGEKRFHWMVKKNTY